MKINILVITVLASYLSACGGEISYKRGARQSDLVAAKKTCDAIADETKAEACMKEQGWFMHQMDDSDLFAIASFDENRPTQKTSTEIATKTLQLTPEAEYISEATQADAEINIDSDLAVTEAKAPSKDMPETVANNTKPSVKKPTGKKISVSKLPTKKQPSPLDVYTISSWWKMGGSPQELTASMKTCVAKLGDAHKPNQKTQQVTRGLAICLREKGWRGLKTAS